MLPLRHTRAALAGPLRRAPARHASAYTAAVVDDHRRCAADVQRRLTGAGIPCCHLGLPRGSADFDTDADIVMVSKSPIGAATISQLRNCKLLIRMGVGFDNVDVQTCREHGIVVCNVDTCTEEVADSTLSHVLNHFRQTARAAIGVAGERATAGHEARIASERVATRMRGKTLGVVGLGKIGRAVAARAAPFGLQVLYHDPGLAPGSLSPELGGHVAEAASFHDLLQESDCVTLNCTAQGTGPLANVGMVDGEAFAAMRVGAALVNTARGELIDAQCATLSRAPTLSTSWISTAALLFVLLRPGRSWRR